MSPAPVDLATLQRWLQRIVTHPGAIDEAIAAAVGDPELAGLVVEEEIVGEVLPPADRLAIYADQYRWRMADLLAAEYPAVMRALGAIEFADLAAAYFASHPPREARVGHAFPEFVASRSEIGARHLFAALARYDRAVTEVTREPATPPLDPGALATIPASAWPEVGLRLIPALRLLQLDYPIHDYLVATAAGEDRAPARHRSWLLVWRRAGSATIRRAPLSQPQFVLLDRLAAGDSLGDAIGAAAELVDTASFDLLSALAGWFKRWSEAGLLAEVITPTGDE